MSGKIVQIGEKATLEMLDAGHVSSAAFRRSAAKAARAAGLSEADIASIYRRAPSEMEDAVADGPATNRT